MKFIFLVTMFTTMLFSAQQRQVIIGSFSVESNALNYTKRVEEQLKSDKQLKALMQKYALKVEYKKIGKFNVVSLCAFENYPSLFETIAVVKKYYPEAYAIKFPAFGSVVETKPVVHQEMPEEDLDALEEEVNEEEALEEELDAVVKAVDEPFEVPEIEPVVHTPAPIPAPIAQLEDADNTQELMLLLLLLVVVIAYVLYKIKTKKRPVIEE